ncbi:PLP-dependent aminotransferase family protein [Roseomonas indoligenes]|uniref:PLP-dependent aminotransferase family protein n=1 Tax=Roseomonas indoligenes TaxID=2820811 RepID=A0A940N0Q3_9PROT|nr:PLP-dependent aminotransferase family protein [Pararoseomonas indoligenes]MBP0495128.1 PLP-dependent aminotransferase family protein [Pararoseomonas indoligenes]
MNAARDERGWVPRIEGVEGPIYLAIAGAIGAGLAEGTLRPGERLPTHRALADALGVDLTTVTRAYAEARRRGLLDARVGRGTFVRSAPAMPRPDGAEGPVDLGMNLPPLPESPDLPALLQEGLSRLLAEGAQDILTYRRGAGTEEERAAGALWLRPVLGAVNPGRVLVCPGAQPALLAVLGQLAGPGDVVLTDALTYPGIRAAAAQLGIRLAGVARDEGGMRPDAVEAACRTLRPKALYIIPTIHNPTTVTMPEERRRALAGTALRLDLPVLEDDAYGLLPGAPLPAIAALAPGITYHVATLSKVLSPALRMAYVVAPGGAAERLGAALRAGVLMASPLLAGLATRWVQDGTAGTLLSAIRRECAARQRVARALLPRGSFDAHPEGLHLWLRLPPRWSRLDFTAHLRRQDGLAVVPSDAFAVEGAAPDAVRLSLGAARGRDALRRAIRAVAAALEEEAAPDFTNVV